MIRLIAALLGGFLLSTAAVVAGPARPQVGDALPDLVDSPVFVREAYESCRDAEGNGHLVRLVKWDIVDTQDAPNFKYMVAFLNDDERPWAVFIVDNPFLDPLPMESVWAYFDWQGDGRIDQVMRGDEFPSLCQFVQRAIQERRKRA